MLIIYYVEKYLKQTEKFKKDIARKSSRQLRESFEGQGGSTFQRRVLVDSYWLRYPQYREKNMIRLSAQYVINIPNMPGKNQLNINTK